MTFHLQKLYQCKSLGITDINFQYTGNWEDFSEIRPSIAVFPSMDIHTIFPSSLIY